MKRQQIQKSIQCDFLIIGQGIAGSLLARQLLSKNISVIILDQGIENSSTFNSGAVLNPLGFKRPSISWWADDAFPYAINFYKELQDSLGEKKLFRELPLIHPLKNPNQLIAWEKKLSSESGDFYKKYLELIPEGNTWYPQNPILNVRAAHLASAETLQKLRQDFLAKNMVFEQRFDESRVNWTSKTYPLEKKNEKADLSISFQSLVYCTGANDLWHQHKNIPLKPVKGEYITIENSELWKALNTSIYNSEISLIPLAQPSFVKIGSNYEWDFDSEQPNSEIAQSLLQKYQDKFSQHFGISLSESQITEHSAGIRPSAYDRRPIMGCLDEQKKLYVFSGLGTRGIMMTPYLSKIFCEYLIEDRALPNELNLDLRIKT